MQSPTANLKRQSGSSEITVFNFRQNSDDSENANEYSSYSDEYVENTLSIDSDNADDNQISFSG